MAAFVLVGLQLYALPDVQGHSVWKQRNEPGPWTICLYHCDEEELSDGDELLNAGWNQQLHLQIQALSPSSLVSTQNVKHSFLERAIVAYDPLACVSRAAILHPTEDLSIEVWLKFVDYGADLQIGFLEGVSLHVRIGGKGDRFQLLGSKSFEEDGKYSAPGFLNFPPVGDWHHLGVTIHAPLVETINDHTCRYQKGCYAQFFYDSHIVGFTGTTKVDLEGFTFRADSPVTIHVYSGAMAFDEIMISDVDWSNPVGHGGTGHGGTAVGHAFEDGRQPASSISDWSLF
ncbi:MAG TPA: hypothetical protein PLX83_21485 [bacterium]|nr:hypothetical protein [bacterium]